MRAPLEMPASRRAVEPPPGASTDSSLELIYEKHFSFVWRSLRALGVQTAFLDDAVQEVFLVVHRRGDDFERRSSIRTWLFGIAYRVAANFRRTEKRKPTDPLPSELSSEHPTPELNAQRAEMARFVEHFLDGVDRDQRAAFTACVLEEMSVPEAAEALGVNVNTLYSRLRSVRSKFAAALAERDTKR
jgi:RNA polymerase sigma-70 factor (ECF subfamily)